MLALVGAYAGYRIVWGHPFTINQLANRQLVFYMMDNPELFTSIGIVDGTILDRHSGKLAEVGVRKRDADYAFGEKSIEEVKAFDRARLDPQDQVTYDILLDFYGSQVAFKKFDWLSSEGIYPISPMFGTQVQLVGFMQTQHVVKNLKTAENYVARLRAMGGKLDALTTEMQRQAAAGVVLPPALLEKSLTVIEDTIAPKPADNALVTTFVERMKSAKGIDPATQDRLKTEAVAALTASVYPAFGRMRDALVATRARSAGTAAGVGRLPDGAAYYQAMLKQFTTTDYTPDQVHEIGVDEVARILTEMDALLKSQGLVDGTVAERMKALGEDPRYLEPNTDEGRARLLARYREILDEVSKRMPEYFRTIPPGKLKVEREPVSVEKGSSGAHYTPRGDGWLATGHVLRQPARHARRRRPGA